MSSPAIRVFGSYVVLALIASATASAQQPPTEPSRPVSSTPGQALPAPAPGVEYPKVQLTAGRSTILNTPFDITRVAITNPAVADAVVVQPREILIDGKAPGTVSLIIWGGGERIQYDVVVDAGVLGLEQQLKALFPGEDIRVVVNDEALILSGSVSSNAVMLKAAEIAMLSNAKYKIINLLQLPGGTESQQVMLQVRFAEVNRQAVKELGASYSVNRTDWSGRATTGQFTPPVVDDTGTTFSDLLNLFFFWRSEGIGVVIKALQQKGLFQSLAEPNLIAYNGKEASFLAGGEFPVPYASGNQGQITIQFKEFGIRLNFTPIIAGDVIRLKVRPEVSTLDFNNGVTLGGFRIPALTTRRAETEVELRDGQSFAIAGLLDNVSQADSANIPFLSSIPIIGTLFKSKAERATRTELMVLITPRLVRALDPDEVPPLPTQPREFLPAPEPPAPLVPADAPPAQPQ